MVQKITRESWAGLIFYCYVNETATLVFLVLFWGLFALLGDFSEMRRRLLENVGVFICITFIFIFLLNCQGKTLFKYLFYNT